MDFFKKVHACIAVSASEQAFGLKACFVVGL